MEQEMKKPGISDKIDKVIRLIFWIVIVVPFVLRIGCQAYFLARLNSPPSPPPPPHTLMIYQYRTYYDYSFKEHYKRFAYDGETVYYLSGDSVYKLDKNGKAMPVYGPLTDAMEIACWDDRLVIAITAAYDLITLDKTEYKLQSETSGFRWIAGALMAEKSIDGIYECYIPLHAITKAIPQTSSGAIDTNAMSVIMPNKNGTTADAWQETLKLNNMLRADSEFFSFEDNTRIIRRGNLVVSYKSWESLSLGNIRSGKIQYYYFTDDAFKGKDPYFLDNDTGIGAHNIIFYQGLPYRFTEELIAGCKESGKQLYRLNPGYHDGSSESFRNLLDRYSAQDGRMQYFVYAEYERHDYSTFRYYYDVGYTVRHHIVTFDMEKWEQTGTLTIEVPRQQVLHVNEKGVYAWRHDEGRIFLTDWEGNSRPISEYVPFTPVYNDEEAGDCSNAWYAEVMGDRLMLFDITDEVRFLVSVEV